MAKEQGRADIMRVVLTMGLPITLPLQRSTIGSFFYTGLVKINQTDTTIAHDLGRQPSGFLVWRSQFGYGVQDGSQLGADWTPSSVVVKAQISGIFGLLIG